MIRTRRTLTTPGRCGTRRSEQLGWFQNIFGTKLHLAELKIGRFRYPTPDPRMAGLMENLDRVNALAERSPWFVRRFEDVGG